MGNLLKNGGQLSENGFLVWFPLLESLAVFFKLAPPAKTELPFL